MPYVAKHFQQSGVYVVFSAGLEATALRQPGWLPLQNMSTEPNRLAIHGGPKARATPLPGRYAFGDAELAAVQEVFAWYKAKGVDFGYQGHFEELYCKTFVEHLGVGGYVGQPFGLVVSAGNNPILAYHHRPHGYFVVVKSALGFVQGLAHKVGVVGRHGTMAIAFWVLEYWAARYHFFGQSVEQIGVFRWQVPYFE